MTKVAVLDFGTARTKVLAAERIGQEVRYEYDAVETKFGDMLRTAAGTTIESGRIAGLLAAVEECANKLGATSFICIATEAFRKVERLGEVCTSIRERFGNLTILDSDTEARLFFESVRELEGLSDCLAADVGGGSVQLAWGRQANEHICLPIGTYALEKEFQTMNNTFLYYDSSDADRMRQHVLREIKTQGSRLPIFHVLVLGSNVMRDFFESALAHIAIKRSEGGLCRTDLDELYRACEGKPYASLAAFFPSNPKFMFGADKLLIIAAVLMDFLSAKVARTTNASISKGLAATTLAGSR